MDRYMPVDIDSGTPQPSVLSLAAVGLRHMWYPLHDARYGRWLKHGLGAVALRLSGQ